MWQSTAAPRTMTWQDAFDYCATLNFSSITGWHLPDIDELQTIRSKHVRDDGCFLKDGLTGACDYYWSSSTHSDGKHSTGAWAEHFWNGVEYYKPKWNEYFVRCMKRL